VFAFGAAAGGGSPVKQLAWAEEGSGQQHLAHDLGFVGRMVADGGVKAAQNRWDQLAETLSLPDGAPPAVCEAAGAFKAAIEARVRDHTAPSAAPPSLHGVAEHAKALRARAGARTAIAAAAAAQAEARACEGAPPFRAALRACNSSLAGALRMTPPELRELEIAVELLRESGNCQGGLANLRRSGAPLGASAFRAWGHRLMALMGRGAHVSQLGNGGGGARPRRTSQAEGGPNGGPRAQWQLTNTACASSKAVDPRPQAD